MLETAYTVLKIDCEMDTLSVLFGSCQIHLPYSYLAHKRSKLGNPSHYVDDTTLLDSIAQIIAQQSQSSPEVWPLACAMKNINLNI